MARPVLLIAALILAGCKTTTVTEYVYVPGDPIAVPVFRPDTTMYPAMREFVRIAEEDVSAFDTLTVNTESARVRAANIEGEKLRTYRQAVVQFFRVYLGISGAS